MLTIVTDHTINFDESAFSTKEKSNNQTIKDSIPETVDKTAR